jgi:hypothetical protein
MWFRVVGWVSAVALLVGVVAGLSPLSSGGRSCGSVFSHPYWLPSGSCEDLLNVVAIPVRVLLIGSVLGLLLAGVVALDVRNRRRRAEG